MYTPKYQNVDDIPLINRGGRHYPFVDILLVLSQFISIASCLTTSPSPPLRPPPPPSSNSEKGNLLIFGHGNVAQSVIKHATTSIHINNSNNITIGDTAERSRISCEPYFNSIICTYHRTPPVQKQQQINGIPVYYVPFGGEDGNGDGEADDDESISHFLKANKDSISQHISHVIMTIPPQPIYDHDNGGKKNSGMNNNNNKIDDNTTIHYRDVVLDSNIMKYIPHKDRITMAFVSTTGVYGDHNGGWVDEYSQTNCKVGTKAHDGYLKVENQWMDFVASTCTSTSHGKSDQQSLDTDANSTTCQSRTIIFRCSGLYGNNFSALHTVRQNGWKAGMRKKEHHNTHQPEAITSRVHLDDVGRAILACFAQRKQEGNDNGEYSISLSSNNKENIYNLSDDLPSPRNEVMDFANGLLKGAHIEIGVGIKEDHNVRQREQSNERGSAVNSERRKRRTRERKQVSNKKMKDVLQPYGGLKYSSFHEGLVDVLKMNEHWR